MLDEHDIYRVFSPSVNNEVCALVNGFKIDEKEIHKRLDYRNVPTFTIDPINAKDHDDAISFRRLNNEVRGLRGLFEIGVHIADVSHYVKHGSALDNEASARGTSVYLINKCIPMLPIGLSNGICSLIPNEDRLAFAIIFIVDSNAKIRSYSINKTVINSDFHFFYEEAQAVLDGKNHTYKNELSCVNKIAKILLTKRVNNGSINFDDNEVDITFDGKNMPSSIKPRVRTDAHRLIEEFMLLANKTVASHVVNLNRERNYNLYDLPFIYRVHDKPDSAKILQLYNFLSAYNELNSLTFLPHLGNKKLIESRDLNRLLNETQTTPYADLINVEILRAMAKASYNITNIGHYGLAFDYYTHFTSPIRRYPDLLTHRILYKYLCGKKLSSREIKTEAKLLARNAKRSSRCEIKAQKTERYSVTKAKLDYLTTKIGNCFNVRVSGFNNYGMFVKDELTTCEGFIKNKYFSDDYYEYNEREYALIGKRHGRKLRLGDPLKTRLIDVNIQSQKAYMVPI